MSETEKVSCCECGEVHPKDKLEYLDTPEGDKWICGGCEERLSNQ